MDTDRKLGEDAAHEGDWPSEGALEDLQQHVEHASDAIHEVVDPERARKIFQVHRRSREARGTR